MGFDLFPVPFLDSNGIYDSHVNTKQVPSTLQSMGITNKSWGLVEVIKTLQRILVIPGALTETISALKKMI